MSVPPPRMIEEAAGIGRDTEREREGVSTAFRVTTGELSSGIGGNRADEHCDFS